MSVTQTIVALLLVIVCAASASAGPLDFTPKGEPRRWTKSTVRVAWAGEIPYTTATTKDINELIRRAFTAWSVTGIDFSFAERLVAGEIQNSDQLHRLGNVDVIVVFTSQYEAVIPGERKEGELAMTFERRRNLNQVDRTATFILVDNVTAGSKDHLFTTLVHEAGHSLGLHHSSVNWPAIDEGLRFDDSLSLLPIMTTKNYDRQSLHPDDEMSAAGLYQKGSFGWIEGTVIEQLVDAAGTPRDGDPIDGVRVMAVRLTDEGRPPPTVRLSQAVFASVTPFGGNGFSGRFKIFVPPGEYIVRVSSLHFTYDTGDEGFLYRNKVEGEERTVRVEIGLGRDLEKLRVAVTRASFQPK